MTPRPYTRQELDRGRCTVEHEHGEACSGAGLYIHSACHPSAGLSCLYLDGILTFTCRQCDALIVKVRVAGGSPPPPPPRAKHRRR